MIHTVKGFGIVNKAEIDVFLELLLFFPPRVGVSVRGKIASYRGIDVRWARETRRASSSLPL